MKNLKALLGTVVESISGPQNLSLRNLEEWDNLWQVVIGLKDSKGANVSYWECMTQRAFDRGDIKISGWYGEKIYADDLLISLEHDLDRPKQLNVYIRRAYARRVQTPIEKKLNVNPIFFSEKDTRPYIHHFTDYRGRLTNSYPVIRWMELIDIWRENGVFKPYDK